MYTTKGTECELVWDYNCSFSLINCSFSGGIMGYMVLFMRAVLILEASMMGYLHCTEIQVQWPPLVTRISFAGSTQKRGIGEGCGGFQPWLDEKTQM